MPEEFGNPWMSNLEQIVPPEAVPSWPPAPGWYVLAAVVVGTLMWLAWRGHRRWRANAYRRQALRLIDGLSGKEASQGISEILKRTALSAYPRADVASLSGEAWLEFLDHSLGTTAFTNGPGRPLADLAFSGGGISTLNDADHEALFELVRRWIKHHRHQGSSTGGRSFVPSSDPVGTESC